jgi:RNA polymerase sigma-70 factor (ECF subfamily)
MREEEALWIQVTRRNAKAFEQVYTENFASVRNFLGIYLRNASTVDDVAQETFLQFWQRPTRFDPARSTLKTYLLGIARKRAADWWRHHQPEAAPAPEVANSGVDTSPLLLNDALRQLDPELRNVLWLREVEGYSYDELSRILDIPLGTVKSRLFSAREQLRRTWKSSEQRRNVI